MNLLSFLQGEAEDRMLEGVEVAVTGCMNACVKCPVMVENPAGNYCRVPNTGALDALLDAIRGETVVGEFLLA